MALLDNVVGALSKSNSDTTIYFCLYTEDTFVKSQIEKLLLNTGFADTFDCSAISHLAIESIDELASDCRLVGLIFDCGTHSKSIVLDTYEDLDIYLQEIAE